MTTKFITIETNHTRRLITLQLAADAENDDNIAEQRRQHGKRVRYGEVVQVGNVHLLSTAVVIVIQFKQKKLYLEIIGTFLLVCFQLKHVFTSKYIHVSTTQTSRRDKNNMLVRTLFHSILKPSKHSKIHLCSRTFGYIIGTILESCLSKLVCT